MTLWYLGVGTFCQEPLLIDQLESDSNRVQVAMSLWGHTLKSGSKYFGWVGPEPKMD